MNFNSEQRNKVFIVWGILRVYVPRMPLVQFVGGTWRVGGLLALSRAFGDAYMKASGFNEGIADLGNDYSECDKNMV